MKEENKEQLSLQSLILILMEPRPNILIKSHLLSLSFLSKC